MQKLTWPAALSMALTWLGCTAPASDWPSVKSTVRQNFPQVRQISVDELAQRLEGDDTEAPLLVDVREASEYEVSHLPGALWATEQDLEALVRAAGPDRDVVLYCSVGYRSSQAAERLRRNGFDNVSNLEGSIFEWANSGRAVERNGETVREVHPYDEEWGRLLEDDLHAYQPGGTTNDS